MNKNCACSKSYDVHHPENHKIDHSSEFDRFMLDEMTYFNENALKFAKFYIFLKSIFISYEYANYYTF